MELKTLTNEELTARVYNQGTEILDLQQRSQPETVIGMIEELERRSDEDREKIRDVVTELKYMRNKMIEEVSDSEIQALYATGTVSLKEIAKEFTVTEGTACKWANGQVNNPLHRHQLKQFIIRRQSELLSQAVEMASGEKDEKAIMRMLKKRLHS